MDKWKKIKVLILDFDGVLTNGFVYVDQNGKENVRCSRKDGLGIEMLLKKKIKTVIISKEKNDVVLMRAKKIKAECFYGKDNKLEVLKDYLKKNNIEAKNACYIGDDVIDIDCIKFVGMGIAVGDAYDVVKEAADYITEKDGGCHAVREVCDLIVNS